LSGHLIWFDAEFTTLDLERARLMQVAVMVTDSGLRPVGPPKPLVMDIRLPPRCVVSPWVRRHLADRLKAGRGPAAVPVETADRRLAAELRRRLGPIPASIERRPVLAGNSIHTDRWLVRKFLPRFHRCLHYRQLDVSSLKFEWRRLCPEFDFEKADRALLRRYWSEEWEWGHGRHDAAFDIAASAAELAFYRARLLRRRVAPPSPWKGADA